MIFCRKGDAKIAFSFPIRYNAPIDHSGHFLIMTTTLLSATLTLILVMDPLGNVPFFLAALRKVNPRRRQQIILRETFIAFVVLSIFLFFGKFILSGMGISESALQISGGILLFLISIRMIFPPHEEHPTRELHEPFIVPLAIPLVAGPSTMTVVMLMSSQAPERMGLWFAALTIAWFISAVILFFAGVVGKLFGARGLIAVERLMGMVLTTMAVQMFLSGVALFLKTKT